MTARIEKTVFISYRRTNLPWALFVYQNLTMHGYDVFFDYQSIDSGNFESVILDNIKARAHFIVILTPSALENCSKPGDWLRREIETAMDENRNIIPLMVENFDFGSQLVKEALTGKLSKLNTYNGLPVPNAYALEAVDRLRERYLNKVLSDVATETLQPEAQKITETQKSAADKAAPVKQEELSAQTWFERGYVFFQDENYDEAIRCYNEAILLKDNIAPFFYLRASAYRDKGELENAIQDYNVAIHLEPNDANTLFFRGDTRRMKNDLDRAIQDFTEAILLDPNIPLYYFMRGFTRYTNGDFDSAIKDYDEVIRRNPNFPDIHYSLANAYRAKGDTDTAIKNYNKSIRINPELTDAYYNRALIWEKNKKHRSAIADYQKYLELGGRNENDNQNEVENKIKKLKSELSKKKAARKKKSK